MDWASLYEKHKAEMPSFKPMPEDGRRGEVAYQIAVWLSQNGHVRLNQTHGVNV